MAENFAPTVLIDGQTVTPRNWMWVPAFALRGVPWAVAAAAQPAFNRLVKHEMIQLEMERLCTGEKDGSGI